MLKHKEKTVRENSLPKDFAKYILGAAAISALLLYVFPQLVWLIFIAFTISLIALVYIANANEAETNFNASAFVTKTKTPNFGSVLSALQYPAFILDYRGAVKFANEAALSTFGPVNSGELITIHFRQPDLTKFIEDGLRSYEPATTNYSEPVPHDRWFAVDLAPIGKNNREKSESERLFILGFHDLTDAKRTEQMRSDFIANASHELRTPIASLLGYIETIRGNAKNDKKATERFLGIMQDQAERMTRLVNDLLSLSRIEMKSHVKPSENVNISNLVGTVVRSLDELAKQMKVEIKFDQPEDIFIVGDEDELIQVFENIIENACKYGDTGEKVDVGMKTQKIGSQDHVTVSIRDYGPGIAIEDQHRITERFYRVDVARSREKQGTGLGLAIVKHILNRHQVRLNVNSDLGEGAEFTMTFQTSKNKS